MKGLSGLSFLFTKRLYLFLNDSTIPVQSMTLRRDCSIGDAGSYHKSLRIVYMVKKITGNSVIEAAI